ncbi:MAG: hypothetical protein IPG91_09065 [Ideonella sp.]|nr:hypothetical protein [Ideonella sp.]
MTWSLLALGLHRHHAPGDGLGAGVDEQRPDRRRAHAGEQRAVGVGQAGRGVGVGLHGVADDLFVGERDRARGQRGRHGQQRQRLDALRLGDDLRRAVGALGADDAARVDGDLAGRVGAPAHVGFDEVALRVVGARLELARCPGCGQDRTGLHDLEARHGRRRRRLGRLGPASAAAGGKHQQQRRAQQVDQAVHDGSPLRWPDAVTGTGSAGAADAAQRRYSPSCAGSSKSCGSSSSTPRSDARKRPCCCHTRTRKSLGYRPSPARSRCDGP